MFDLSYLFVIENLLVVGVVSEDVAIMIREVLAKYGGGR